MTARDEQWRRSWAAAVLFLLALLCKEPAAALIAVIAVYEIAFRRAAPGRVLVRLVPFLVAGGIYAALRTWALEQRPTSPEACTSLGLIRMARGRPAQAIEAYTTALGFNPDYAEVHNDLGIALARTGRAEAALGEFAKASALAPDNDEYARASWPTRPPRPHASRNGTRPSRRSCKRQVPAAPTGAKRRVIDCSTDLAPS